MTKPIETIYREPAGAENWNYWLICDGLRVNMSSNQAMTMVRRDGAELVTVGKQIAVTPQVRP